MQKHSIVQEFPAFQDKIHELKMSDTHFRKMFNDYHDVDHQIHSIETGAQPTTDEHLNELRLKRVHLKDRIFSYLQ
jgi:hypothetical protein